MIKSEPQMKTIKVGDLVKMKWSSASKNKKENFYEIPPMGMVTKIEKQNKAGIVIVHISWQEASVPSLNAKTTEESITHYNKYYSQVSINVIKKYDDYLKLFIARNKKGFTT